MADQQQLELLRQGIDAWNAWRAQHPTIYPDLREASLSEANLSTVNLSAVNLSSAYLNAASLNAANLSTANLSAAYLYRAELIGANLNGTNLSRANLIGANLREATLIGADLNGAELNTAELNTADLSRADLSRADLRGVDFSEASLKGADFSRANLSRANLSRADLHGADLRETDLRGADLRGADLGETIVGRTIFGDVDLRTVRGLETVEHRAPSTIGTDTILRSEGDIPEVFLRGAGLTEGFIAYTRSLALHRTEYYTCFISYSSQDQDFAERLYTDLQSKGVRCWFASEDLKSEEKFWHRIDESIRLYDKLLVILSEHSVDSAWVENEVTAALKKEQHHNKLVFFPIKLDETVMQTHLPWAVTIRRSRHLEDFTRWKERDAYEKSLKRLLRDLKAEHPPTSES